MWASAAPLLPLFFAFPHCLGLHRHRINMLSPLERLPADILIGVTDILGGDKASWDALRCSSRCLREGIGRRITSAILTTSRPSLSCFPRHGIPKKITIRGDGPLLAPSPAGTSEERWLPFGSEADLVAALHAACPGAEGSQAGVCGAAAAGAAACNLGADWASSVEAIDVQVRT